MRMPNRSYRSSAWQAAVNDGVTTHLDPIVRRELGQLHSHLISLTEATALNNRAYPRLFGLSRSLPLDPGARIDSLATLDELRGRVEIMSLRSGQTIGDIERAGLTPNKAEIARFLNVREIRRDATRQAFARNRAADRQAQIGYQRG